ncbi:MBL fold metallo-hydrolase, partial [Bacillus pumilus]
DLRESAGNISKKREELAEAMFETIQSKLKNLNDNVIVYPAHGAGSLCGKALSDARFSTIGDEKKKNYAFQINDKKEFVSTLLEDQPFIPAYFGNSVAINSAGAPDFSESINSVKRPGKDFIIPDKSIIIDTRDKFNFRKKHLKNSINISLDKKFE